MEVEWRPKMRFKKAKKKKPVPPRQGEEGTTLTCSDLDQTEAEY